MEETVMTRSTGTAHARWLGGMAAMALAFAGTSIAIASSSTDPESKVRETVIVKVVSDDAHAAGAHADHEIDLTEKCGGTKPQVDTSDESKGPDGKIRHARIVICNRLGEAQADILAALEKARARLAEVDELSDAAKAKALASLDEEIARLKSRPGYTKQ
jgi:hypothetical protein